MKIFGSSNSRKVFRYLCFLLIGKAKPKGSRDSMRYHYQFMDAPGESSEGGTAIPIYTLKLRLLVSYCAYSLIDASVWQTLVCADNNSPTPTTRRHAPSHGVPLPQRRASRGQPLPARRTGPPSRSSPACLRSTWWLVKL